jgi:echinoderm microtubule-associated protein-like 5
MLCSSKVDRDKVTGLEFKTEDSLVTVGMKHVKFFTLNGRNITIKKGLMGVGKAEPILSVTHAFTTRTTITGTMSGCIIAWNGRSTGKRIPDAHTGPVMHFKTI